MILGSLFILNLFVGVVIDTFNKEKDKLSNNNCLTRLQHEYLEVLQKCYTVIPERQYEKTGILASDFCRDIALNSYFNNFILICIILNTICLSVTWYDEPEQLTFIM